VEYTAGAYTNKNESEDNAMRQLKFKYYMQHEDTGIITYTIYELEEIESYDGIQIPHRYFIFQRSQFTGLLDKNGVEIYEGDILPAEYTKNGKNYVVNQIVIWNQEYCGFTIGSCYEDEESLSEEIAENAAVIGNIHQNKVAINLKRRNDHDN